MPGSLTKEKTIIAFAVAALAILFSTLAFFFGFKVLLMAIIAFFSVLFFLRKPFFSLVFYFPASLYFGYVHLFGFTPRNFLLLFYLLLCILFFDKKRFKEFISTRYFLVLSFVVLYILIFSIFIYKDPLEQVIRNIIQDFGLQIVILAVVLFLINTERQLNIANKLLVFFMLVSCIIAIGQFFGIDAFWNLRRLISSELVAYPRIAGLSYFNIQLTFQLALVFPFTLALYHITKNRLYLLSSAIIFITALFTKSRSCFISFLLMLIIYLLAIKNQLKLKLTKKHLAFFVLLLVLASLALQIVLPSRLFKFAGEGSSGRLALYSYAFLTSFKNPLGVGLQNYHSEACLFYPTLDQLFREADYITIYTSHNQYLNILVFYGWPVFFALVYFSIMLLRDSYNLFFSLKGKPMAYNALAVFVALVGFIINSLFHNDGFFLGNSLVFFIIAELIVIKKLMNIKLYKISAN